MGSLTFFLVLLLMILAAQSGTWWFGIALLAVLVVGMKSHKAIALIFLSIVLVFLVKYEILSLEIVLMGAVVLFFIFTGGKEEEEGEGGGLALPPGLGLGLGLH